jgi:hypothetical protein
MVAIVLRPPAASSLVHLPLVGDIISARSVLDYDNVRFYFFRGYMCPLFPLGSFMDDSVNGQSFMSAEMTGNAVFFPHQ